MILSLEKGLSNTNKKGPFAVMCKKMENAIKKDSKAHLKTFQKAVDSAFKDIQWQFDNLLTDHGDDEGEDELKDRVKDFLPRVEEEFADVKLELKRIKRKYGMGEIAERKVEEDV